MEGLFTGGIIFEYIGVITKWLISFLKSILFNKKRKSFEELCGNPDKKSDEDLLLQGISNRFVGAITIVILVTIVYMLV